MRKALGTTVFSGMLGVTVFGIFFTPVFYVVVRWLASRGGSHAPPQAPADGAAAREGPATEADGVAVGAAVQLPEA